MEFVHPERLWFLFLLLIPIVIHLFHFRKRRTLYFSSLRFIQFLEKEQQSTRKLKHLLVLLSRVLALTALVLAFAQPELKSSTTAQYGKRAAIIYLDNSFSMSAIGTEGSLFSEGRELAKRIITKLAPDTRILLCSNQLQHEEQRFVDKATALRYLDALELYALPRTLNDILDWQQQCIKQHETQYEKLGAIQHFLISDFQKSACLMKAKQTRENQSFYAYQLKTQNFQNTYIDSIWFAKPTHQYNTEQTLMVRIKQLEQAPKKRLELKIEIGKIKRTLFVEPSTRNNRILSFPYTEINSGFVKGLAQINDHQIHFDDTWYFTYEVPSKTEILLIEESSSSPAVAKAYSVESRYHILRSTIDDVNASAIQEADLIVLNGINSPPSGLVESIVEANQNGKSVLVIPGDEIQYNDYQPLLSGLSLPSLGQVQNAGLSLQHIIDKDPFFSGVFEKKQDRLNIPLLKKSYSVIDQIQSGAIPLLLLRSGQALFLRTQANAFLFTAALQADFGSMTNQSLFPTLLLRCAEYSSKHFPEYAILGKDVQIKVRAAFDQETPLMLKSPQTEFIVQHQSMQNLLRIQIGGIAALEKLKANHYDLRGDALLAKLALNYNRTESDLSAISPSNLLERFENNGIKNCTFNQVNEGQSLQNIELTPRSTYWRILLIFALLFLLAELALLKWWK